MCPSRPLLPKKKSDSICLTTEENASPERISIMSDVAANVAIALGREVAGHFLVKERNLGKTVRAMNK